MFRVHFLPVLSVLVSVAASGLAQSVLPYLPENTVMAVSVPDLDASIGELSAMPLAKMWHEKEVQDFFQDAHELVAQQVQQQLAQAKEMHKAGHLPVDPDQLLALRLKGLTFAITKLAITTGDADPMPEIGIVLQLDFGTTAPQWFGLVQMGLGLLAQDPDQKMGREDAKVGDCDCIWLSPKDAPPGLRMGLNVAMLGNSLILGTLREDIATLVENAQKGQRVLAATPRYQASTKPLAVAGAEAEMFMRIDPMLDFAISALAIGSAKSDELSWLDVDGLSRAVDALGLRGIQAISSTSSYVDGKAVTKGYTVAPAPDRKGLLAGANKNLDVGFLKWVPKDAVSFSAWSLDAMTFYDALVGALNAYDSKTAEMLLGKLSESEKQLGFSLRDDFFSAIGDTVITWSMPLASFAAPPELALLIKVNDQERIVKVLKNLTAISNGMVELDEADKRGVKTYQFRVNFDPMRGMGGGMNPLEALNPCFAFKDGYMVAGFSTSDIRQVFKRMDRQEEDPKGDIRGNKEYAAHSGSLPANMQALSFTDWKAQFESYYQVASSLLAFLPQNENIPFDMSRLPDASTLTKHLFGAVSYSTADGMGMATTSIGPFGPETFALIGALVAAGVGAAGFMRGGMRGPF